MIRAVLDTNVLASGAVSSDTTTPSTIIDAWANGDFLLIISLPILTELERTLTNAYFTSRLSPGAIAAYLNEIRLGAEIVPVTTRVRDVASHSEDDLILSTAINGNAEYLVTGDRALQQLESYSDVALVPEHSFGSLPSRLRTPQPLRGHAQRPVELARRVLPGNDRRQLDQCVAVEEPAQPLEELILYVSVAIGHTVGVLQHGSLHLAVERASRIIGQRQDLLVGDAGLAAHGSLEVLSELAAVDHGDPPVDERREPGIDQPGTADPGPHRLGTPEYGRPPRIE